MRAIGFGVFGGVRPSGLTFSGLVSLKDIHVFVVEVGAVQGLDQVPAQFSLIFNGLCIIL